MKRSTFFLTLSAAVLAIAALASSKVAHRSIHIGYYTTVNSPGRCVATTAGPLNASVGSTAHAALNGATLHTRLSTSICGAKLYSGE